MKKKDATILGIIVTVLFLGGGGGLVGKVYQLLGRTEKIEEQVEENKEDVEEAEEEIDQEENINIQQQGQIDSTLKLIEKLDRKLDKALAE
jgi:uncharacterized protein HemX